jgi:hypothetical protein
LLTTFAIFPFYAFRPASHRCNDAALSADGRPAMSEDTLISSSTSGQ